MTYTAQCDNLHIIINNLINWYNRYLGQHVSLNVVGQRDTTFRATQRVKYNFNHVVKSTTFLQYQILGNVVYFRTQCYGTLTQTHSLSSAGDRATVKCCD